MWNAGFVLLICVADHTRRIPVHLYLHGKTTHFSDVSPMENKETPFQTTLQLDDVTYSLRHVEESWIHLLKAGMRVISFEKGKIPFTYFFIIAVFSSLWGEHVCKNVYFVWYSPHTFLMMALVHLKHWYLSNTSHGIRTWSTINFYYNTLTIYNYLWVKVLFTVTGSHIDYLPYLIHHWI